MNRKSAGAQLSLVTLLIMSTLAGCPEEEGSPARPGSQDAAQDVPLIDAGPLEQDAGSSLSMEDGSTSADAETTYTGQVRPILARSCVPCHSAGQIAPFSLDTYERAKSFAPLIAQVTRARTMPPSVVDNSGECNTFRDLPWLSEEEIATLGRWAELGAPEGDRSTPAPAPRELPKLTGDVRSIRTPNYVPSKKRSDDYRCFVIDSPFKENTFVTGFDTKPGDQKTAHHMVVFYPMDDISATLARVLDDLEEGPGYTCFGSPSVPATILAAWAPGGGATAYPDKLGIPVVPNRPLIVQMHYNTAAVAQPGEDSTQIDLQVQADGVSPGMFTQILDLDMNLAPGQKEVHEVVKGNLADKVAGKKSVDVYGVFPHMHELGEKLTVKTGPAGGAQACLVDAPRYEFHWQRMYFFDKPITLDAANEISVDCHFNTSSRSEITKWGEGTQDEMCVIGLFIKL